MAIGATGAEAAAGFPVSLVIDTTHPLGAANPLLLGSNAQWVDRGDELLRRDAQALSAPMVEQGKLLGVTLLRYPGGSLSDLYHWRDGMGPLGQRGQDEHFFSGHMQRVEFGTQEFLELCEAIGAQPLITVNTATGSPEEAAQWVRQVNIDGLQSRVTGKPLPKVHFWEVGNEPYLKDDKQRKLWETPDEFANRASATIEAMRRVDPSIEVGIPLRSDRIGGLPATPLPGFNETVLRAVKPRFDFVALHDAYLPHATDRNYSDDQLYWATMASSAVVEADLAETRQQLTRLRPGQATKLTITEYNTLYSYGGSTESYIDSPTAALGIGLLLRMLSYSPDVAFANFWSLSGNWHFGAINQEAKPRPAFAILHAFRQVLRGTLLGVQVEGPTFDTERVGYVPAMRGLPMVRGIATIDNGVLRLLVINCDPGQAATVTVRESAAFQWSRATVRSYQATGRFDTAEGVDHFRVADTEIRESRDPVRIEVPPVGFAILELSNR